VACWFNSDPPWPPLTSPWPIPVALGVIAARIEARPAAAAVPLYAYLSLCRQPRPSPSSRFDVATCPTLAVIPPVAMTCRIVDSACLHAGHSCTRRGRHAGRRPAAGTSATSATRATETRHSVDGWAACA